MIFDTRISNMIENEIIHVISAGASIHKTFPVAVNELSGATKAYIIVEDRVYEDSKKEEIQEMREKIRGSINELKKIAGPFVKNGIYEKRISEDTLEFVRDAVIDIYSNNQNAKFFFNVSGGTKLLSIGLFMMALWIDANPYIVDQDSLIRKLSIPKILIKDLTKNPNRVLILEILKEQKSKKLLRTDLLNKMKKDYIPIRDGRNKKKKRNLTQGGFDSLTKSLIEWGFISEAYTEGSKKLKEYFLTPDGEFTLNFVNIKYITKDWR